MFLIPNLRTCKSIEKLITNTAPSGVVFIVVRIVCNSQADFLHKILFFGKDVKVFLRKHYFC